MKSLNRVELVLGGIIILIFMMWFLGKCSSLSKYTPQEPVQKADTSAQNPANNTQQPAAQQPAQTPTIIQTPAAPVQTAPTKVAVDAAPTVYVITAGLKLRDKPGLNGTRVIGELPINTALSFLNEQTDFKDKITVDGITYNEPWIKVKTKDNAFEGWVFGGGVRPYQN
jgi:hypothetical protein